jgi:hypothetical protein
VFFLALFCDLGSDLGVLAQNIIDHEINLAEHQPAFSNKIN